MTEVPPVRTFVYGSCVARDTFDRLGPGFELSGYVARQSLVSALSDPWDRVPDVVQTIESPFQRRMQAGDLTSDLLVHLARRTGALDLLLWDLTDERLGFYVLDDGTVVTRSIELLACGLDDELARTARLVPFGTDEHLRRWVAALDELLERLDGLGLTGRLVVLGLPWARRTDDGRDVAPSFGVTAREGNRRLRPYHAALRRREVPMVSMRPWRVRASSSHAWGEAPFHYAEDVYAHVAEQIRTRRPPTTAG
jgi:hypothetical protein